MRGRSRLLISAMYFAHLSAGLSEGAIEQITEWKYAPINSDGVFLSLLDQVLMSGSFHMLMYHIHDFRDCVIAGKEYWKLWEEYFLDQMEMQIAEGQKRKDAFCAALKKMVEGSEHSNSIKDKIWAEYQLWDGDESSESLRDSLINVDGFSLIDVYEYRASKDLPDLLNEIRNSVDMGANEQ